MSDDLTRKAIVTFNGSYADGLTKALQAVVNMALEEAAKVADAKAITPDAACEIKARSIAAAIRAMIPKEDT